ncbi:MAG: hypothetical protein IT558_03325 [Alphaproteobacteria bacterium]|nr:hypothetical protein [Alphaproteobacteria bacterium]
MSAAPASANGPKFEAARRGDVDKTCMELSNEAFAMQKIIARTQEKRDESELKTKGIGIAGTAASFLVGTMTGGIGFAAAGYMANHEIGKEEQRAEEIQDLARQRRGLMVGIFKAKDCNGPIEQAMSDPKPMAPVEKLATMAPAAGEKSPSQQSRYNP